MGFIMPPDNKLAVGAATPDGGVDGSEWGRNEPLLTPDQLKSRFLFGISMYSATPDPVTRKVSEMTNDMIKDHIARAVNRIELQSGFLVFPVVKQIRLAFDRAEYLSFGYMQLPDRPVMSVQSLDVITATGESVYRVPNDWVSPGHLRRGQVNIVPLQPAFLSSGYLPSQTAGGAAFLSILGQKGWVPEYWQVTYTAGFEEGKIPMVVNDLIGCEAAIEVLGMLQATRTSNSHSIGVDGLSQSVSTPGPQVYQARIEALEAQKKTLMGKLKTLFNLNLFSAAI